ncbi:ATP-binding protein [Fenollaria timonensis]|uniref:ATP-binding protein n=1 Tax=Fenollaria timonensis TaxID=1723384 RepID=UPI0026ED2B65|nr:ATP-binding protein [Fenollaria timonensis]
MIDLKELLSDMGYDTRCINFEKPFDVVENYNNSIGKLNEEDDYNCDKCKNRGDYMIKTETGEALAECECMRIRRAIRELKKSGLENQIEGLGFDSYKVVDELTAKIKRLAIENLKTKEWFFIGGQTGSGKTHISTAIAVELLRRSVQVRYKRYMEMVQSLKSKKFTSDADYYEELVPLINCGVLYIDDLFKGKVLDQDVAIIWEIIDDRYTNGKKTIISSEMDLSEIARLDESLAGRINQRAGKYVINIEKNKAFNRRLNNINV